MNSTADRLEADSKQLSRPAAILLDLGADIAKIA
jgi:hypothetical protein